MKKFFKDNWKFLLFVLLGGIIGGYFYGLYLYDELSGELISQLKEQNITKNLFGIIVMIQYSILYGVLLAIFGIILSKKTNLWRSFKYNKEAITDTFVITIVGSLILYPGDKLLFGTFNSFVNELYLVKPTFNKIIGGLLLGGITEEVMMRLFLMSLLVFIISKLFYKKESSIPVKVFIISNIVSALLFAVGHIPATMAMTTLTPLLIIRCILLNGILGLCFGYLYRKYGIGYAMISHGFIHFISDILMLIIL